ncbi:NUDIX hydrolase [Lutimonas sp.]|uniref:NUDIX hydrolase n=1 Tax=Lutimonas sp. TaxID=1872403 RepID=UPI003D9B86F1
MSSKSSLENINLADMFLPGQSVDCVIIGFEDHQLKILILKWKSKDEVWGLPGGFIRKNEDIEKSAVRVLSERTGVQLPFLEQFKTFGRTNRNSANGKNKTFDFEGINKTQLKWLNQRFITSGYLSLVNIQKCNPKPGLFSEEIRWAPLEELPELILDHDIIVRTAIRYIKNQINYLPFGINLLQEKFTMKELQLLYEAILEKKLDRGNFQRKMLKLDIFIRHEKQLEGGAHKAPYLYSFHKEKYEKLLEQGYGFNS